jgi:hypothetical protein
MTAGLRAYDEALLRRAFDVASRSRAAGDHPFGSLLADGEGRALMEQGNGSTSGGWRPRPCRARPPPPPRATRCLQSDFLARCALHTREPARCARGAHWRAGDQPRVILIVEPLKAGQRAEDRPPSVCLPCPSTPVNRRSKSAQCEGQAS